MISILPGLLLVAELVVHWLPLTCQSTLHYFIRGGMETRGSLVTVQGLTPDLLQLATGIRLSSPRAYSTCVCKCPSFSPSCSFSPFLTLCWWPWVNDSDTCWLLRRKAAKDKRVNLMVCMGDSPPQHRLICSSNLCSLPTGNIISPIVALRLFYLTSCT